MNQQEKSREQLQLENEILQQQLAACQHELSLVRQTLDLVPIAYL